MSNLFGGNYRIIRPHDDDGISHVMIQRDFQKLLSFAGRSIDEIVNCPIAKRDILQWFRISRSMKKRLEVLDLEKQWNPLR